MIGECCGNCKLWDSDCDGKVDELTKGICTRFPPTVPIVAGEGPCGIVYETYKTGELLLTQPTTYASEYCGEWRADDGR